jgi:dTDP-4-amino-4,6-dideoxygalactose transaminase
MIICAGGKPVFVDIDPVTMNIDPKLVSKKVTSSTAAILITHLHGMGSDMKALKNLSKKYKVPLIEDSAQSLDAKYLNKFLGTIGDIGVFSMGRAKNINTFFGGFMTIKDNNMTNKINSYLEGLPYESKFKLFKRIFMCFIGDILTAKPIFQLFTFKLFKFANSKGIQSVNKVVQTENNPKLKSSLPSSYKKQITDFQCFLAINQFETIKRNTIRRLQKAKIYFKGLKNLSSISIQPFKNDKSHVYLQFPIQLKNRVEFVSFMMRFGCDVPLQHLQSANELKIFKKFKQRCPVAKKVAESVVLLPTYPAYPISEVKKNIAVINKYHYFLREKLLN